MTGDSTQTRTDEALSLSAIVARAPRVARLAARCAEEAEAARRLTPEVVEALKEAGFARHFVPAAHGGTEGGFEELTHAVGLVGEGCASAAWAASLAAYAGRYAAFLPTAGQAEIWADGPDVLLAGALMPAGQAERVPGGWRLSGEWKYISGVHFADWVLACSVVPGEAASDGRPGGPPGGRPGGGGEVRFFAVPKPDVSVRDSWFTLGMRGTGSDTLVLSEAFVPDHLTLGRSAVHEGRAVGTDARCHIVPMYAVNALPFAAPLVGAARGALRAAHEQTGRRLDRRGNPVRDKPSVQIDLARSAAEVDAAELLVRRTARAADGIDEPGAAEAAVRGPRDLALAVELLVSAVERLFRATGTAGHFESDPVQRFRRDIDTAASHVALSFETTGAAYGAWALGAENPTAAR
ncbi:acyl-CoA dehydrogenase family protein [Streptomyces sp. NPDC046942]|uniref:acyl-CoA dehydrogenase family protein n=1 Tax=Streptomyces sp. NPDC046942 TaxID=3155137 RepID=UPI0033D1A4EF